MGVTHVAGGAAAWLAVSVATHASPQAAALGTVAAGYAALLPDIGQPNSLAAHSIGPVTGIISRAVQITTPDQFKGGMAAKMGHRKAWTHSAAGLAGWCVLMVYTFTIWNHAPHWLPAAAMTGWASHLFLDCLTEKGCALAWPWSRLMHLLPEELRVKTGLDAKQRRRKSGRMSWWKHHTGEWWVVRPLCMLLIIACSAFLVVGHG